MPTNKGNCFKPWTFRLVETPGQTPVCQNDEHPWVVGNVQNIDHVDFDGDGDTAEAGNGGQVIEIPSWTRFYQANSSFWREDVTISDAVAYTTGGSDSVLQFINELEQQKQCLNESRNEGWTATTAPNNDWNNYDTQVRTVNSADDTWTSGVTGSINQLVGWPGIFNNSWQIPFAFRKRVVPGDILYMRGHVAIVARVDYDTDSRNVEMQNVHLIEATGANGRFKVVKFRSWFELRGQMDDQLIRLRTDN